MLLLMLLLLIMLVVIIIIIIIIDLSCYKSTTVFPDLDVRIVSLSCLFPWLHSTGA
jgi:hypothetical protein